MKYPVAIFTDNENGCITACAPDLGACTEDDTYDGMIEMIRDAAQGLAESMRDDGMKVPPPSSIDKFKSDPFYEDWQWIEVDLGIEPDPVSE